jgi:hypothetical protein
MSNNLTTGEAVDTDEVRDAILAMRALSRIRKGGKIKRGIRCRKR